MTVSELSHQRRATYVDDLRRVVQYELAAFASHEVERRLRVRPHFLARTPHIALAAIRKQLDAPADAIVDALVQALLDLHTWYRGSAIDLAAERAVVDKVVGERCVAHAQSMLNDWVFPGDERRDHPDDTAVDLDATWSTPHAPQPLVYWAWHRIRCLEAAERQRVIPELEHLVYLPEELPADRIPPR